MFELPVNTRNMKRFLLKRIGSSVGSLMEVLEIVDRLPGFPVLSTNNDEHT